MTDKKLTDGLNDRPRNAPIGQSAEGFPDDSAQPVETDEMMVEATKRKLPDTPREKRLKEVKQQHDASRLGSE
ncbi:hypothetical protein [Rhizobium sullae]|uniref:hypothetical protein n=1 Tax=Rhizobium sullae TaxID=50338 RepID=UPI000B352126|nr:hypothetical protein [Rhizobium sullae]